MTELKKSDTIQEHSSVYVRNGHWKRYFKRDTDTGHMLAITPTSNGLTVERIPDDATYDDLHHHNTIIINDNDPFIYDTKQLPDVGAKAITLYADTLYTNGVQLLSVPETQTHVVADPEAFDSFIIHMNNEVTQEELMIFIGDLHTLYTPKMSKVLYTLATHGSPDEQLYMRVATRYNKEMKELTEAGQSHYEREQEAKNVATTKYITDDTKLDIALRPDTDESEFIALFEQMIEQHPQANDPILNLPGHAFSDGSSMQYFIGLTLDKTNVEFRILKAEDMGLTTRETILLPISDVKSIVYDIITEHFDLYADDRLSLDQALHQMVHNKVWHVGTVDVFHLLPLPENLATPYFDS